MKVLYDHQAFTYQTWGGVSKSFCELIKSRPVGMDYDISIKESNNTHLIESNLVNGIIGASRRLQDFHKKHSFLGREKIYNFLGECRLLHTSEYANKQESIRKLQQQDFDVFHPTFFDTYFLPYIGNKPFVITVHDLMPELFGWPKTEPQIANKPILLEKASAIVTISENTKEDLCRFYNVDENKIHVIYHGAPECTNVNTQRIISEPYFLYIGRRDTYKNFNQTLIDFSKFHVSHPEVKLVCTGQDFSDNEQETIRRLNLTDSIIHIFTTDEELASLYSHAIAFVFPSLYEGFGMPILEAFSYGCPVLLNNKSCFPEIAKEAAIYFDSCGGQSNLPDKLEEIYTLTSAQRDDRINLGYKRLEEFSWNKSAIQLVKLYTNIRQRIK